MLELKNLCFGVENEDSKKEIIKDVSFVVPDEKFVVITGPNGGGKSTLARLIMGIEKPKSGRILLNGQDITDMGITERARLGISFALQQPVRFKGIHVVDLLRLASGKELSVGDACEYLSAVGLCARDYIDREVNASLSGGEMKRIEIATVLARGTTLSVFDEPEAGIDLSLRICRSAPTPPSSSSPIRSASLKSPIPSSSSRTGRCAARAARRRCCPSS